MPVSEHDDVKIQWGREPDVWEAGKTSGAAGVGAGRAAYSWRSLLAAVAALAAAALL